MSSSESDPQSFRALSPTWGLVKPIPERAGQAAQRKRNDRLRAHQSGLLGSGGKRESKSRVFVLVREAQLSETAGVRLITLPLTGGKVHDYTIAKRLTRRPPKHMLGDTAYHDDELREKLVSEERSWSVKTQQHNSTVPPR